MQTWNQVFLSIWSGSQAPAVVDDNLQWSGEELLAKAAGAAQLFDRLGIDNGRPVPVLMDETPVSIALAVGAALSRRAVAPLGTKLPLDELVYALHNLGVHQLIASREYAALGQQVADKAGIELHIIEELPSIPEPLTGESQPDDPMIVVHTSGTTGRAKPIFMTQGGFLARTTTYQRALGTGQGDRFCSASPFYHTAGVGMVMTVLGCGASVIPQNWFSVENWQRAGRLGMTWSQMVPTMIDILLSKGAFGDASPRVFQYGASPIHPSTLREALAVLPNTRFFQFFGQTEASPLTCLPHEDHLRALQGETQLLGSVGKALPGIGLQIENPDEEQIGEITVRADLCFVTDDDGWRRTGDLGRLDKAGYLYLSGRANDRIIRGGENIYPLEVENAIRHHPQVSDVAVVGIPDRRWGEIVKAFVVPESMENPPGEEELREFSREKLAHFKVPESFVFIETLPRNPSGKLLRRQLLTL